MARALAKKIEQGDKDAPVPDEYVDKAHTINMDNAPPGSKVNAAGHPRNNAWFWRQMLKKYPEMFGPENRDRIETGDSPIVDKIWIKAVPIHKPFEQDKLIHHHINQGAVASGLPESAHSVWHGLIHKNSGGK